MGFFEKEEVPPAPNMAPIINAGREVTAMATDMAKETFDWATKEVANNKDTIGKFVDQMVSDSDTARGMVQNFQDISNKQLGLAEGAADIRDAAVTNAAKQGAVQDTQLGIQQKQLSNQDAALQYQKELQQIQQDFRGDQQAIQQKAAQLYDQYSRTYPAAMEKFAADAAAYDTPERRAQMGAEAKAGVGMQFQAARDAATRQLESFGIKPSDTRLAALDLGTRIKEAAAKASADRMAQLQTEQQGFALREAAIKQGSALPGQATAMEGVSQPSGLQRQRGRADGGGRGQYRRAHFGQVANTARANAIGAGNAASNALQVGTGATNAAVGANTGATQAQTGALAADTAAANITRRGGRSDQQGVDDRKRRDEGAAAPYVAGATGGVNAQTGAVGHGLPEQVG